MHDRDDDAEKPGGTPAHASPYPVSRLAPAFDLVDTARAIAHADGMITAIAGSKLSLIADQIRALQAEARAVLEQAQRDLDLHRARCAFERRPGHVYHLYRRAPGELYFSMLSPADWQGSPPHEHVGSYRLEVDQSFTPVEHIEARDRAADELAARLSRPRP